MRYFLGLMGSNIVCFQSMASLFGLPERPGSEAPQSTCCLHVVVRARAAACAMCLRPPEWGWDVCLFRCVSECHGLLFDRAVGSAFAAALLQVRTGWLMTC